MITNKEIFQKEYKCKKKIARYLIYECSLPILGLDGGYYYFAKTEGLEKALKKMPVHLKLASKLAK